MAELDSQPKSIQSLYGWYNEGKLTVNRRYQRKLVWTLEEKQRLVESILKRYPVPAVLLAERPEGGYEIIDGLQRLYTLMSFIETGFNTLDGRRFDVAAFPTANDRANGGGFAISETSDTIAPREVSTFLDYTLAVSVMRGATEDEIDDVFGRINTYGHQLSDQERRQAGVQDALSETVRTLGCSLRGDESSDMLDLSAMPSISIDLPKTKHGYQVRADEVFWVAEGILRSTDLRDSMDEQCIADILACVAGGKLIPRSKEALDAVYQSGDPENARLTAALETYGTDAISDEIKYCIDEILKVTHAGTHKKLRSIVFSKKTNNAFAALFATIVIAFHEVLIGGKNKISNYAGVKTAITKLDGRIDTGRGSTSPEERRKNVDAVKGLLSSHVVTSSLKEVYSNHSVTDIDSTIRRSEIEHSSYELKQGILRLSNDRSIDENVFDKVIHTICAIANNGPQIDGTVIIGVADKAADVRRIIELDAVTPRLVGKRSVVGVRREATALNESTEIYFARWKSAIKNSELSSPLREDVLSKLSYHDYFGLGIIVVSVPKQTEVSYVGADIYIRSGDDTEIAADGKAIASVLKRFHR
ncbi:GmrSD restriction endonuclease domain-containing protein [Agromyces seonyuensis]|uniref:DUF262 domain-containing protein n=1 Tax=Agromyces seonyuensis TaxID=2662446 RepID=A0A6I4P827_9MICO|nr:DUF262 domain-containing protein [Agromyces seonyuensis]MWC00018.1 DUF262 domain-containing protein [Agromyces seonyuensis]